MTGRNDPCPCGSGKKYKHCHLEADKAGPLAARVVRGEPTAGEASALALPAGAVVPTDRWEVDLVPYEARIANDLAARPTVLMVGAGDYVLHADVITRPPADADAVAQLLADALAAACRAAGCAPRLVQVRLPVLVDLLAERLADDAHPASGAHVSASLALARIDDAVTSFEAKMGLPPLEPGAVRSSFTETWAAWGLAPELLARFFEACAALHRAAPWALLFEDDLLTVRVRGGGTWHGYLLGASAEPAGLVLHADREDLMRVLGPAQDDPLAAHDTTPEPVRDVVLTLTLEPRDALSREMRDEIRRARWTVDGPEAYPMLSVLNTPGGGLTARQMQDLIAALEALPGFVEKHAELLEKGGEAQYPLRHTDVRSGTAVEMSPV